MATDSDKKKPENKGQGFVDAVFYWSIDDVLNRNLYKGKVSQIPTAFQSVSEYTKSFVYPLLEETHADLNSQILGVSRSPIADIIKVKKAKDFKLPTSLLYTILLKRLHGSYVPKVGDLIALTDVRPRCVDDLRRPNRSYIIALVERMKKKNSVLFKLFVLSSEPINLEGFESDFVNRGRNYSDKDIKRFAVYLTNLTTNIRIWQALHPELEGDSMKMMKTALEIDSSVEESCAECSIDKNRTLSLLKLKDVIQAFKLDSSQEAAVLSCLASRQCRHRNTIKLIWGPPGTGKTKTVGSLLFMLLRLKCRTLTCAPTNIAVLGVTKRVMSLLRDSLQYNTYGLGDVVLFGNEERMKIDDYEDLVDIFLNFRVDIISSCLAPFSGWKGSSEWMICFLEDPEVQYSLYLMKEALKGDEEGESGGDAGKDDSSNGDDIVEDDLCSEKEESSDDSQIKKAMEKKNWKTLIVDALKGNKKGKDEVSSKQESNKKNSQENLLTFEEFVIKGYNFLGNHLISCIEKLYTHMPTAFISVETAKQMVELASSLKMFGNLLKQTVAANVGLREALNGVDNARTGGISLHSCRMKSLEILKYLQKTTCFPEFKEDYEIRRFCLANACLIFCTATSSISLHTEGMGSFEFLVIDEAAQLKECESTIPLQISGLRHAILVGDERQLPAMVQSKISEEAGFGRSLFERLVSFGHKKHLLNVQYRMHPAISQFPNREFYDKKILDGVNVKQSTYGKRFLQGSMYGAYSFINVTSGKEELDRSHSTKNLVEVAIVAEIVASLFKESVERKQRLSVGCISPYKAQVYAIQEKLGKRYVGSESYFTVNVRSVDGFQGGEEDVVIISTVRCNAKGSVGFLANHQRANVALTRARYCLWVLGNGATLMNSGSIWKNLVADAKDRCCFFNASEDKNLAQATMDAFVELGQLETLFDMNYLPFNEVKWKVKFSDSFLETFARLTNPEIRKQVVSLLVKLSSGWRLPENDGNKKVNIKGTCPLLEDYIVNEHLSLIWAVEVVVENSICIQALKVWDILPLMKIEELTKMLMKNVYGNYTINMMNRCKEKCVDGNLTLPITWPINSDSDPSWSLANQLATLNLSNKPTPSSSSTNSSRWGFRNGNSNKYSDSRSLGRGNRW